jgi:hypothetical protein
MVVWHPSGEVLASCSYDDTVKLWVDSDDEWICAQTLTGMHSTRLHTNLHLRSFGYEYVILRVRMCMRMRMCPCFVWMCILAMELVAWPPDTVDMMKSCTLYVCGQCDVML